MKFTYSTNTAGSVPYHESNAPRKIPKALFAVIPAAAVVVLIIILSVSGAKKAEVKQAYDAFGSVSFSDESILTNDELATLENISQLREQLFQKKDLDGLTELKKEWDSFKEPIDEYINVYQTAKESFLSDNEKSYLTDTEKKDIQDLESKVRAAYKKRDKSALNSAIKELDTYSKDLKAVLLAYSEINQTPFTDKEKALLSSETLQECDALSEKTEAALTARDAAQMQQIQKQWDTYSNKVNKELERAKEKLLDDWVKGANLTSSAANLFSFGTITSSVSVEGHTIILSTQYNYETDSKEIKKGLDSYLSLMSSFLQSGANDLKQYIKDVCIRIEYKDCNGNVISSKEFR